jgi:hypothetical protein
MFKIGAQVQNRGYLTVLFWVLKPLNDLWPVMYIQARHVHSTLDTPHAQVAEVHRARRRDSHT